MKETSFIEQNKEKWNRFEKLSEDETRDPGELSDLYMDITDDLSYAQTFYKRRTVRVYLNHLAQRVYTGLHIQKGESLSKFITVWKVSLPLEIYRARKNLLFTLIVFAIWAFIGAITTKSDPSFARVILGNDYVAQTDYNIAHGNPLQIYETNSQLKMFIDITTNNIRVAFLTFVLGIFFTVGTHILLFSNGIMLGTFQYYFATKGLLVTSFLGIWIHGAFEISSIVLAGGAGITLGNGLLFPKNYTRLQSLQLSAKRGLKLMMSLVPFLIIAGFLESYVTHNYQDLSEWSKWLLIGLSFTIILFYYVIYPIIVAGKYPELVHQEEVVNYYPPVHFDLEKIRTFGQVISDTFRFYRIHFQKFFRINLRIIFPLMLILVYFQDKLHTDLMATQHWFDWSKQLEIMMGFGFGSIQDWIVNAAWSVIFTLLMLSVLYAFDSIADKFSWKAFWKFAGKRFAAVWVGNFLLFATMSLVPWYWYAFLLFLLPLFYLNGIAGGISTGTFMSVFKTGWRYSVRSYGRSLLNILIFTVIFALLLQPIALVWSIHENYDPNSLINIGKPIMRDLLDILADFVKDVAHAFGGDRMFWSNVTRQVVYLLFIIAVFPLWIISMTFLALSEQEKETANGLKTAFKNFGKRSRYQENDLDFE